MSSLEMGKLIRNARLEKGMTIYGLAAKANINRNTISQWESGAVQSMSYHNAQKISETLDIPIESLRIYDGKTGGSSKPLDVSGKKTARRIKELREQYKLTQVELAKKIGVTKYTICSWETGRTRNIQPEYIKRMGEVFHVRPSYISGVDDVAEDVNQLEEILLERPEAGKLLRLAAKATPEQISIVCKLFEIMNPGKHDYHESTTDYYFRGV